MQVIQSTNKIIHSSIRHNSILNCQEKILLDEIISLCQNENEECWARNEYFADKLSKSERTIRRLLQNLKLNELVVIKAPTFKEPRKIIPTEKTKLTLGGQKWPKGRSKMANASNINNTTNKNTPISPEGVDEFSSQTEQKKPPKKRLRKTEEKLQRNQRIWTTTTQHTNLVQKAAGNELLVMSWYQRLSEWKIGKEIDGGNDYLAILKWVIRAVEEAQKKDKKSPLEKRQEVDKAIIDAFLKQFPSGRLTKKTSDNLYHVTIGHNYIEFYYDHRNVVVINIGDFGFKDQVLNNARKMGMNPTLLKEIFPEDFES